MKAFSTLVLMFLICACSTSGEEPEAPLTALEEKGAQILASGEPEAALEIFREAAYEEKSYRGLVGMAYCYAEMGDIGRFETLSMEAASRSPRNLESQKRLGVLFVKGAERFRMRQASTRFAQVGIEYLRRVYAVMGNSDPNLLPTLGLGLHLADMDESAAIILNEALQADPTRIDVIHSLVQVYRRMGDRERVLRLLAPWTDRVDIPKPWAEALRWAREGSS